MDQGSQSHMSQPKNPELEKLMLFRNTYTEEEKFGDNNFSHSSSNFIRGFAPRNQSRFFLCVGYDSLEATELVLDTPIPCIFLFSFDLVILGGFFFLVNFSLGAF